MPTGIRTKYTYFFKRIIFKNTRLIFAQNLRTISASAEEQNIKFSVKIVYKNSSKCRTCKKHFASCLFTYNCSSQLRKHKQKLHIAYLIS